MTVDSPLWTPTRDRIAAAAITRFTARAQPALEDAGYGALHRWSVEHRAEFWSALWDFAGIVGDQGLPPYLRNGDRLPGSRWFPAARLNYAENLLRRDDDHVALVSVLENGRRETLTYRGLRVRVAALAAALAADGVVAGDRVAGYVPNVIDAVLAMLATTSLGAVFSSCSGGFRYSPTMSRTFSIMNGSVESLKLLERWGCRPNSIM